MAHWAAAVCLQLVLLVLVFVVQPVVFQAVVWPWALVVVAV